MSHNIVGVLGTVFTIPLLVIAFRTSPVLGVAFVPPA
jgi:hypothetical protein